MNILIGLLRAVNVGGTGKLPMDDLKAMCVEAGFENPRTYIASGNLVFGTDLDAAEAKAALEERLAAYAGKKIGVMVRTRTEMEAVLAANPFPKAEGNKAVVIFLDAPPPADTLDHVTHRDAGEEVALGACEIYVHYPNGQGRSKLRIPAAKDGTARNMNTVAKLAAMARDFR